MQHLADLALRASQRFLHRELTERVTFVFVIVIVPLQITAESGRSVAQRYHC